MTSHSSYPSTRDSGLPWLGHIPAHWNINRLKFVTHINMGQSPSSDEYNLEGMGKPFLQGNAEFGESHPTPKYFCDTANKFALPNDYLLSVRAPVGALNVANQEYGIGRGLCAIRAKKEILDQRFTWYLIETSRKQLDSVATGSTYDAVSVDQVGNVVCIIPPLPEQRTISAFLDRQTAKIDALITKKQRLLDLLAEQRAALISQAVTKGLPPSPGRRGAGGEVRMKDSGVAWLGRVPSHWEVKRLGTVSPLLRGHDLTTAQREEGDIPVISSSGFSGYHNMAKAKGPGVVTGRYGTTGKMYYVEQDFWPMNTALYVYDFKGNFPRYIYYLLQILPFDAYSGKSAVPGIDRNDLHPLLVCQPPRHEQEQIAAYIDQQTKRLDDLAAKVETAIARLHEYRAALISSAVTGKIKVKDEGGRMKDE